MTETMNPKRLERLIEAYGAEPARWPASERAAGERHLADHHAAQARLNAARALDAALDAWGPQPVTAELRARVLAAAPQGRARRPVWTLRGLWLSGAGLAACAAGAITGAVLIAPSLASAFPVDRGETASALTGGLSVFGSPLDAEPGG